MSIATRPPADADLVELDVDVVVPVHDEAAVLERSITRLDAYLSESFPFTSRITVVDNASTDDTWSIAIELAARYPRVRARHLDRKGRGLALRDAWTSSRDRVVAYTDVDLSTDLDALLPLVAPLLSGHSDLAIGSRLAPDARVARHPGRELTSRGYNLLLRTVFATRVRDAQCGFKAVRADVARRLVPHVLDDEWFFDTELLLLAERNGLRIHQVPVDWVDDLDSRVAVARTAWQDLRGSARVARAIFRGEMQADLGPSSRHGLDDDFGRFMVSFGAVGATSTAVSLAVFLLAEPVMGPLRANALALSTTFVGNTWAHAHLTARRPRPEWGSAAALYLLALVSSSAALRLARSWGGGIPSEVLAVSVTNAVIAVVRVAVLRHVARS